MGSDIEPDVGGDVGGGSVAPPSGVVELGLGPNRGQAALLVSIVAFVGAIAYLSVTGDDGSTGANRQVRWESSAQCKSCHPAVYAEWLGLVPAEIEALRENAVI